jgi:hypothetical protein
MIWATFIGEGRSGHTIVSAIIDSHPNARMSEEQKYIGKWCRYDLPRKVIRKKLRASGMGKERSKVALPGQLRVEEPTIVMGDKCGWDAVNEVRKRGEGLNILQRFQNHMNCEAIKVIHTSRNPFDNISAWVQSPKYIRVWGNKESERIRQGIKRYSRFYQTAEELIQRNDVYHIRNEELCAKPKEVITGLMEFLNLPVIESHIDMCAAKVFKKPNRRSTKIDWTDDQKEQIYTRIIRRFPSLHYYDV